jgi:hypothetical protein
MDMRHAGLMPREERRQLIRWHQEINGGHNQQDDAEQSDNELHGRILLKSALTEQKFNQIQTALLMGLGRRTSAHPGAAAALAFDHPVALLQKALAFAILAFLLLLDVGTLFIGHGILQAMNSRKTMIEARVLVYKHHSRFEDFP